MPIIDLRDHIVYARGTWRDKALLAQESPFPFGLKDTCTAGLLMLRWRGDSVALAGPLRIRVSFQSENITYGMSAFGKLEYRLADVGELRWEEARRAEAEAEVAGAVLSRAEEEGQPADSNEDGYRINLAARRGYPGIIPEGAGTLQASTVYSYTLDIPAGQVWPFTFNDRTVRRELGNNIGDRVLIELAGLDAVPAPVASSCDLPCDFAVADRPDAGLFFPSACEPCDPTASVGLPPLAPALAVPAAEGGCVRTRFFDGMSIRQADLENEQRYFRMKNRLRNRAAGQGVVWGLNVGKQAGSVFVLPGYAVDCCGNDITITSVYKVDVATLLRDPKAAAACASGKPTRMHLLLEYVECPGEPRPVHGDPCGPGQARCEMSRVRETARLRLVEPRDPDTSGPIEAFLAAAKTLHGKYGQKLEKTVELVKDVPSPASLRIMVGWSSELGDGQVGLNAKEGSSVRMSATRPTAFRVRVVPTGTEGGVLTGGVLRIVDGQDQEVARAELARAAFGGETTLSFEVTSTVYRVIVEGWRVESPLDLAPGWADVGEVQANLLQTSDEAWQLDVRRALRERRVPHRRSPCGDEPCNPRGGEPANPWLPWLHGDALSPAQAGDPKVLLLGLVSAWLQNTTAAAHEKTPDQSWSVQRLLAGYIYRAAWLLFYGVEATDDRTDVAEAVQQLLRGWCAGFLYPGPSCAGEPHGVVIGCTTVSAGSIGDIDPYGGRRHVVQYPLLAHWGSQVGLAPLDVSASRLFSTLCCVASLPRAWETTGTPKLLVPFSARDAAGRERPIAYLAFGTEEGISEEYARVTNEALRVEVTHQVSFAMFVGLVISLVQGDTPRRNESRGVERYVFNGLAEPGVVSLLVLGDRDTRDNEPD